MTTRTLVLRYSLFAVIATIANLAAQRVALALWPGSDTAGLAIAIALGTGVGLVIKYVLDKRWIFQDLATGAAQHARKFGLYTLMGVATTLIFWGSEAAAWAIWRTDLAREGGAILGLTIGYVTKYQLDRRFVFNTA